MRGFGNGRACLWHLLLPSSCVGHTGERIEAPPRRPGRLPPRVVPSKPRPSVKGHEGVQDRAAAWAGGRGAARRTTPMNEGARTTCSNLKSNCRWARGCAEPACLGTVAHADPACVPSSAGSNRLESNGLNGSSRLDRSCTEQNEIDRWRSTDHPSNQTRVKKARGGSHGGRARRRLRKVTGGECSRPPFLRSFSFVSALPPFLSEGFFD